MKGAATLRRGGLVILAAAATAMTPGFYRGESSGRVSFDLAEAGLPAMDTIAASAPGQVVPISSERDLAATAAGRLTYVAAEGQKVKAGDLVAEIDNSDLRARLVGADAEVAMRQAELERLLNGAREEDRRAAAAAVAQAQAKEDLAKIILRRRLELIKTNVTSSESVDRARAEYKAALANTKLLSERLALINAPPRPEDTAIAKANLAAAQANVNDVKAEIDKTRLTSPVDGIVLRRYKAVGETVAVLPPTLIATVGDVSGLRVRADVDESDVAKISLGQAAWVTADAYGARRFPGVVSKIGSSLGPKRIRTDDPAAHQDSRVLEVWINLTGTEHLPIGLRVDVFFKPMPAKTADRRTEFP